MSKDPSSYVKIPRRLLTPQEEEGVRQIVLSNPRWADAKVEEVFVEATCTCGCRSVVIERPSKPQNPLLVGHQGLVGGLNLSVTVGGKADVISVLLHFAEGSISLLEVVWYNFPDPVPSDWIEISRRVSTET
jgi:hypothetical protein